MNDYWSNLFLQLAMLFVFSVFITAILEVIKGIALKGVWNMLKELWNCLIHNTPLTEASIKVLTFAIALLFCRVFNYGAMSKILQITIPDNKFAGLLDYIGTSALIYMGSGWAFDQFAAVKAKLEVQKALLPVVGGGTSKETTPVTTTSKETTSDPVS